jgi:hypothetical protein
VRKFLPLLIILLVLFPSCAATLSLPEPGQESDTFSWWLHNLKSPEQLQAFLKQCTYVSDLEQFGRTEYFQTPDEFFRNRKGDCEDFAYFSAYVFLRKRWAFRSFVVFIARRLHLNGHAIAVAQTSQGYIGIDYSTFDGPFPSLEEAVRSISQPYDFSYIERILEVKLSRSPEDSSKQRNFCPLEGCQ